MRPFCAGVPLSESSRLRFGLGGKASSSAKSVKNYIFAGLSWPALRSLCAWEQRLLDEGVTTEEFRLKLVEEMKRIRREQQRTRDLQIELESTSQP